MQFAIGHKKPTNRLKKRSRCINAIGRREDSNSNSNSNSSESLALDDDQRSQLALEDYSTAKAAKRN